MVNKACVVAVGFNAEGRREVWGISVGPTETEAFWKKFLRGLVSRGLAGVHLVISDAHEGLKKGVAYVLQAPWQRCRTHFMREVLGQVAKRHQSMVAAAIRWPFRPSIGPIKI